MSKHNLEKSIIDYLDGRLTADEEQKLREELKKTGEISRDLDELQELCRDLENLPAPEPSARMSSGFYRRLENIQRPSLFVRITERLRLPSQIPLPHLATAILIFAAGWTAHMLSNGTSGYEQKIDGLTSEIRDMKEFVALSMLRDESPSHRMSAISKIQKLPDKSTRLTNALIRTLNHDENVNVRLVALEALLTRMEDPRIRNGIVLSMNHQQSPLVQLALADAILMMKEKNAIEILKTMLTRKNLNFTVREKISATLEILI